MLKQNIFVFNADGSFNPIYLSQLKIQLNQDFVFCLDMKQVEAVRMTQY